MTTVYALHPEATNLGRSAQAIAKAPKNACGQLNISPTTVSAAKAAEEVPLKWWVAPDVGSRNSAGGDGPWSIFGNPPDKGGVSASGDATAAQVTALEAVAAAGCHD